MIKKCLMIFAVLLVLALTASCSISYPGSVGIYLIFTIVINFCLVHIFFKSNSFFEKYLATFLWLGLWLKLTYRVGILDGKYVSPVGEFNFSGKAYDDTLIATIIGILGFWVASIVLNRLSLKESKRATSEVTIFYRSWRKVILISFISLVILVCFVNVTFGFYQKGMVPKLILPFGLNGVFTWLLNFGLASITCLILDFEIKTGKNPFLVSVIGLIEIFFSNVSLLSRGFILNGSSLLYGAHEHFKKFQFTFTLKLKVLLVSLFLTLFVSSVIAVNYIRLSAFSDSSSDSEFQTKLVNVKNDTFSLFIDRWVGLEGIMSVSSSRLKGWDLWREAWQEDFRNSGTSFYDHKLIESQYLYAESGKHHFINLPGIIAFLFYPGSYVFLFFGTFVLVFFCRQIEIFAHYASSGNLIFCSLIGMTLANRLSHFGYAPSRSYVLLGTVVVNILIVFFTINILNLKKQPAPVLQQEFN